MIKHPKKRIIAGWVVILLVLLIALPIEELRELRTIDSINALGVYGYDDVYKTAQITNIMDCMRMYPLLGTATIILGIAIPMQCFSYLFSLKKVNLYLSLPVSQKSRFLALYFRCIVMYVIPLAITVITSVILLGTRGLLNGNIVSKLLVLALFAILLYIGVANITLWAIMLTGRLYMAIIMDIVLLIYFDLFHRLIGAYMSMYFKTLCTGYDNSDSAISVCSLFLRANDLITNSFCSLSDIWQSLLGIAIKMIGWCVLLYLIVRSNFKRRPAEAAESVITFYSSRILMKLLICVPTGLGIGKYVSQYTGGNQIYMILAVIITIIVVGMILEMAFDTAILPAVKHWGSIIVSVLIATVIWCFFRFDLIRYDKYIPDSSEILSYAVLNVNEPEYSEAIDFDAYPLDYETLEIGPYEYAYQNMQLVDSDTIVALARKSQKTSAEDMGFAVPLDILYRLESGREVARRIWVDINDRSNDAYLNRIIGPAYYKKGIWQAFANDIPDNVGLNQLYYYDGITTYQMDTSDADRILRTWRSDMVSYDYNCIRYYNEVGCIKFVFDNYMTWTIPVYDNFGQLASYLNAGSGINPIKINANKISEIVITSEDSDTSEVHITDPDTIALAFGCMEKTPIHQGWVPLDRYRESCKVEIILNQSYTSECGFTRLYCYKILNSSLDTMASSGLLP